MINFIKSLFGPAPLPEPAPELARAIIKFTPLHIVDNGSSCTIKAPRGVTFGKFDNLIRWYGPSGIAPEEATLTNGWSTKVANGDTFTALVAAPAPKKATGVNPKDALGLAKPDLSVVPPAAELHLASAMMDGAAKYGAFNWRENAVIGRVYVAAARRHLLQYLDGEDYDPVSGVHHLGHAMACCAIILDAAATGNLDDNRPKPGAAGRMIRGWTKDTKLQKAE